MQEKERLDIVLTRQGLYPSREKAQAAIMAGCVYIDNQKADKPGTNVNVNILVEIRNKANPYVSRGGLKLEKALKCFHVDVKNKVALDAGASTGGFTDCLLKNGARKVFAVDVGYGQLAWELRNDPRVVNMERVNVRYIRPEQVGEPVDIVTMDVSFISIIKVIPTLVQILHETGWMICLVKPQFEAGREKVGKKGVVKDSETHREVLENVIDFVREAGFGIKGLDYSPIKGPEGNIEYLLYLSKKHDEVNGAGEIVINGSGEITDLDSTISEVVEKSHREI